MPRGKNYIPCDDIQGQLSLNGLELSIRVEPIKPVEPVKIVETVNSVEPWTQEKMLESLRKVNWSALDRHVAERDRKLGVKHD